MASTSVDKPLPRRDLLLVPLVALATAMFLLAMAEVVARLYFVENQVGNCGTPDPVLPYRYRARCSYQNKAAEGPLVSYSFNDCGYRTRESCAPKPAGSIRIALLGASTAMGFKVPHEDSMAVQAAASLQGACQRAVEVQNMGVAGFKLIDQYYRIGEAIDLQPDLIGLVLTPYELVSVTSPDAFAHRDNPNLRQRASPHPEGASIGLLERMSAILSSSSAALAAQYFLFQDKATYVRLFLKHGDKADYLRESVTPAWQKRLQDIEVLVGGMADRARASGVPFAIVYTPQRVQAALSDPAYRPQGVDPAALGRQLQAISERHAIAFIDVTQDFLSSPDSEKLFYPVDGHMTPDGHRFSGRSMAERLLQARAGVFAACRKASQASS